MAYPSFWPMWPDGQPPVFAANFGEELAVNDIAVHCDLLVFDHGRSTADVGVSRESRRSTQAMALESRDFATRLSLRRSVRREHSGVPATVTVDEHPNMESEPHLRKCQDMVGIDSFCLPPSQFPAHGRHPGFETEPLNNLFQERIPALRADQGRTHFDPAAGIDVFTT